MNHDPHAPPGGHAHPDPEASVRTIALGFTLAEFERLTSLASDAGETVEDYVRSCVFGPRLVDPVVRLADRLMATRGG